MNRRHPDLQLEHSPNRGAKTLVSYTAFRGLPLIVAGLLSLHFPGTARISFAANLPITLRTSTNLTKVDTDSIKAFVEDQAGKLGGADAPAAGKAREALVAEVQSGATPTQQPSAAFLDAYALAINNGLAAPAKSPEVRVRMNAAIVVAKVAMKAENARLSPITITLLNDSADTVVSWAAKATASELFWVLSPQPANAKPDPLLSALMSAGKKPKADGMVVQNVYAALNLSQPPNVTAAVWTKVLAMLVPEVQGLVRSRVEQYKDGMPQDPAVERYGLAFIARKDVWNVETPAQQAITNQLLVDIIAFGGQRLATAPQSAQRGLAVVVNEAGKNIWVVADNLGNLPLKAAVQQVMAATVNVPANQVVNAAANNYTAVAKLLPGIKQPPALSELPSTQPAMSEASVTTTRSS